MSSFSRDATHDSLGSADESARPIPAPDDNWLAKYLPPAGVERTAFIILAALIVALKVLAIYHYRSDSDETQHAHVVWSWVTGRVQYRDVFDNHMPLFQLAMTPVMRMFGERPDIMIMLRWTMLPFYFVSVWAVYWITRSVYDPRLAAWSALLAATVAKFFYTSTEFRTDQAWAAFWLLSLMVAVSGKFTARRALAAGLLMGVSGAISVKSVPLVVALGTGAVIAFAFGWWGGQRNVSGLPGKGLMMALGMVIPPAAVILSFASQGLFWIMYYCVIGHNMVPGLKRWGNFSLHQWYFPISLPLVAGYAWLIFRQTPDRQLAMKRAIVALMPWCFLFLLLSYWPDITREDDLPYVPLIPVSLFPIGALIGIVVRSEDIRRKLLTYGLPVLGTAVFLITLRTHDLFRDRMRITTNNIADVLLLTKPNDYVMDVKGDYVFRPRAYYWVLEPLTKARVRMGLIHDNIPADMIKHGVTLCFMRTARDGSLASRFIAENYVTFDPKTRDMGTLGQVLKSGTEQGVYYFTITIPQTYDVVNEKGSAKGVLDGKPYSGAIWLAAGQHVFRDAGFRGGSKDWHAAILWDGAFTKGFLPQYNANAELVKEEETQPAGKRNVEAQ